MVAGATVNGDSTSLSNILNTYSECINNLSTCWRGLSYDNLANRAADFLNEVSLTIGNEMASYASACDLLESYKLCKTNLGIATENYNKAAASNYIGKAIDMKRFAKEIDTINADITRIKSEIEALLAQACSTKFEFEKITITPADTGSDAIATFTPGVPLDMEPGVHLLEFTTSDGKTIKYNVIIPENATEGMPVIMYLNGDGHIGNAKSLGYVEMAERVKAIYGDDAPFIVVQPVSNTSWKESGATSGLNELVQQVVSDNHADPNRVVLTGASGGGIGSWNVVNENPNLFSAFVPVSGDGRNIDLSNFLNVPVYAITSGDQSDSWNAPKMQQACEWINENGGNANYETRPGNTHDTMIKGAYTQELFEWMIAQSRQS